MALKEVSCYVRETEGKLYDNERCHQHLEEQLEAKAPGAYFAGVQVCIPL